MKTKSSIITPLIAFTACLLGAFSARGGVIYTADFSGKVPAPGWHYFDDNWKVENYNGAPSLSPEVKGALLQKEDAWLRFLAMDFRPNTSNDVALPLAIDCDVVTFANASDADRTGDSNRFCITFVANNAGTTSMYSAVVRPGGLCEIQDGADFRIHTVLAKAQEPIVFPEGKPAHVQFVWHASGLLELFIDGQSVVKTNTPASASPAPYSICIWERFGKHDPVNRVLFQKITISQPSREPGAK